MTTKIMALRKNPVTTKAAAEQVVKDIRRATRKLHSSEEKIRIVLSGLRGEDSIAELCRKEGIAQSLYYSWSKEFLEAGMSPPSPYSQIDLLKTARQQFRFPSNKLDYVGRALGLGQKVSHEGFELWIKCMNKDKDAWTRMQAYNVQDVLLLEKVYKRFLPWIKNHPNRGVHMDTDHVCPTCGSDNVKRRGYNHTKAGKYQRYQCGSCATWSSTKRSVGTAGDTLKHIV